VPAGISRHEALRFPRKADSRFSSKSGCSDSPAASRASSRLPNHTTRTDPLIGSSVSFGTVGAFLLNLAATVEPDCDHDGLGDESQDTNLSGCQAPSVVQPVVKKNKGKKKKHKHSAESAKKKKCKNKKKR
jgi:hypothetical protein